MNCALQAYKLPALFSACVAFAAMACFITLFYVEFLIFGAPKERGIDGHIFASALCTNNPTFCLVHVVLSSFEIVMSRNLIIATRSVGAQFIHLMLMRLRKRN